MNVKEMLGTVPSRLIAFLLGVLILSLVAFYWNTTNMMKQYKIDKAYSDRDRIELTSAIKDLRVAIIDISKVLAVNTNRILTCEKNIDRLHK